MKKCWPLTAIGDIDNNEHEKKMSGIHVSKSSSC